MLVRPRRWRLAAARPDPRRRLLVGIAGAPGREIDHPGDRADRDGSGRASRARRDGRLPPCPVGAGGPRHRRDQGRARDLRRRRLSRPAGPADRRVPRTAGVRPRFERAIEEPIAGAIEVGPDVDIVITEGNYLLLDEPPWSGIRGLRRTRSGTCDVAEPERLRRLVARHVAFGRSPDGRPCEGHRRVRRTQRRAGDRFGDRPRDLIVEPG